MAMHPGQSRSMMKVTPQQLPPQLLAELSAAWKARTPDVFALEVHKGHEIMALGAGLLMLVAVIALLGMGWVMASDTLVIGVGAAGLLFTAVPAVALVLRAKRPLGDCIIIHPHYLVHCASSKVTAMAWEDFVTLQGVKWMDYGIVFDTPVGGTVHVEFRGPFTISIPTGSSDLPHYMQRIRSLGAAALQRSAG